MRIQKSFTNCALRDLLLLLLRPIRGARRFPDIDIDGAFDDDDDDDVRVD